MDAGRPLVDWRSAAPYAILARSNRHAFAWEWLRRSHAYVSAMADHRDDAARAAAFGLCKFEPAELGVPDARPIWRGDADPFVLTAIAVPASGRADAFDFAALSSLGCCTSGASGGEHWLWSDGVRHIRLDILEGTLLRGPVWLDFRIAGLAGALPLITALSRLIALARTGRFLAKHFAAERRAARWALILRTHDALSAGASPREIAEHLFGIGHRPRWRIEAAPYHQRVRRLVVAARAAARADPRQWFAEPYA